MDEKTLKLLILPQKDLFMERLNLLIEEIEQWEIDEDDISSQAIFHNLIQAKSLYTEYISQDEFELVEEEGPDR